MKNNGCLVRINSLDESDDWLIQSDDWLRNTVVGDNQAFIFFLIKLWVYLLEF